MSFIRFLFYKVCLTGRQVTYKNWKHKVIKVEYGYRTDTTYVLLKKMNSRKNTYWAVLSSCYRTKKVGNRTIVKFYRG